jgi:hypothetical protein
MKQLTQVYIYIYEEWYESINGKQPQQLKMRQELSDEGDIDGLTQI